MSMIRSIKRLAAVLGGVVATTVAVAAGAAGAHATVGDLTVTLVTPDLAYGKPGCVTVLSMQSSFSGGASLDEAAAVHVSSSGCGPVSWRPSVFVLDDSPTAGTFGSGESGAAGNPATASASQVVHYGVGVRELGIVTLQFTAASRLGDICYHSRWQYDAVTFQIKPLATKMCSAV